LVERIALALSAGLLLRYSRPEVADAFVATRIAGGWSGHFGDLPAGADAGAIARRAVPQAA
jgi:putative acyl-CoA dehydrogenase